MARPRIGLVLNVGIAHIGEFGGQERHRRRQGRARRGTAARTASPSSTPTTLCVAAHGASTRRPASSLRRGDGRRRTVRRTCRLDERRPSGVRARARAPGARDVTLRLFGEHHASNALAAAARRPGLGMPLVEVAARAPGADPRRTGGWRSPSAPDGVTVVNDAYNANPDIMRAALRALADMGRRRGRARTRGRCWARWPSSGRRGARRARRGRTAGRPAQRRQARRGRRQEAAPAAAGRLYEGSWGEESVHVSDAEAAVDLLRASCARATSCL